MSHLVMFRLTSTVREKSERPTSDYRYALPNPEGRCPTNYPRKAVGKQKSITVSTASPQHTSPQLTGPEELNMELFEADLKSGQSAESALEETTAKG